jgi:hypothetical protein
VDDAIREIEHQSGQQFDPQVVSALRQILEEAAEDDDPAGPGSRSSAPGQRGQSQATRLPTGDESGSPARGRITRR